MTRNPLLFPLLLTAFGVSCVGHTPEPKPATSPAPPKIDAAALAPEAPAPAVTPQPGPYRGFPVSLPALVGPELGPYFEQLALKFEPANWYVWREQTPPPGFRELRKTGKFPGGAFATVRAYEFGYDRSFPRPSVVDRHKKDCGTQALAADGTLCPSVIGPGVA